ncbi:MAG: hypothetical protein ACK4UP_09470 [Spirosomataceae bacterium]
MSKKSKFLLVVVLIICSVIGFMLKLPRVFRHYDKELHTLFYFCATLFMASLYPRKWFLVAFLLAIFGIGIEAAQSFSNRISIRLIGKAIHGRFDIEDVWANCMGIGAGLVIFLVFMGMKRLVVRS